MLPSLFLLKKKEKEKLKRKEKGALINWEEITILNFYVCLYV